MCKYGIKRNSLREKTRKPCSSSTRSGGCACIISGILLPPRSMRIRRRPRDVVLPSTAPPSAGSSLPPAAPARSPRGSSPACPGAAAPEDVKLPPLPPASVEADGPTSEATPIGPHLPPHGQDRQGEGNEGGDDATEKRKRRAGGGAEQAHGVPAQASSRYRAKADEEGQQNGEDEAKAEAAVAICKKGDGKGWRCKRVAQRGCSLCQYHLAKLRSYSRNKKRTEAATPPPEATPAAAATAGDPLRRASRRRKTSDKEPGGAEGALLSGGFYYYSGFGPRWGKSRRDRAEDDGDRLDAGDAGAVAEEEEDYGHGDANGGGKPSKSRSLASLL